MKAYQFSLLRYMHSAVSGELVNIGLVMWIPSDRRLLHFVSEKYSRISNFFSEDFDGTEYRRMVRDLRSWFESSETGFAEGQHEDFTKVLASLVPPSPSCFQWSAPMGGLSRDPVVRFDVLVHEFIERYSQGARTRRDEMEIWTAIQTQLKQRELFERVQTNVIVEGANFSYRFKLGWQNGVQRVLEPISFDYLHEKDIVEKANVWAGRLFDLRHSRIELHGVMAPPAREDFKEVFERAKKTIASAPGVAELVTEADANPLLDRIAREAH